jgi:hypothetical protein
VNHDLVVMETQKDAVFGADLAAAGLVLDVADFARRRGLAAAARMLLGCDEHGDQVGTERKAVGEQYDILAGQQRCLGEPVSPLRPG